MTDLQIPAELTALYEHQGPFATVYLDATRGTETGGHEVELRLRGLADWLRGKGADDATLDALREATLADAHVGGPHGLALVARDGAVRLAVTLPDPPLREFADWAPLPHLAPLLAQSRPRIAHVAVVVDHHGAAITAVTAADAAAGRVPAAETVEGSQQYPIHLTSRDEWDERHVQNRTQDAWAANAREVADVVRKRVAEVGAELVVVGGDPRSVGVLRDELAVGPGVEVAEIGSASRAPGAEDVTEQVAAAVHAHAVRARHQVLAHLRQNLGRGQYAVAGVGEVVAALQQAQADTVILSDDPSSTLTAWIGPRALDFAQNRADLVGVEEPQQVRLDAALVRAVAGSGANLLVIPNAHQFVRDGVAALLRY
jgi:hypothetical protein